MQEQLEALGITVWSGPPPPRSTTCTPRSSSSAPPPATSARPPNWFARCRPTSRPPSPRRRSRPSRWRCYHELDPTLYSVTSNTFIGQVYALFGLTNIADGAQPGNDYPQLNAEFIVQADPDADLPGRHQVLRRVARDRRRPAGLGGHRRGRATATWSPSMTTSRRVGGHDWSTSSPLSPPPSPRSRRWREVDMKADRRRRPCRLVVRGSRRAAGGRRRARRDGRPGRRHQRRQLEHHLEHPPAAGGAGRHRRRNALAGGRQLSGRVPQPARRPVPAGCGRRRRPGRHARLRLRAHRDRAVGRSTRCPSPPSSVPWLAVLVTYVVGASFGGSGLSLVLAGVAVAALGTALQQYLLLRNSDVIKEVYSWISGRVSTATWGDVRLVMPYVFVAATMSAAPPPPPRCAARGRRGSRHPRVGGAPGPAGRGHRRHPGHGRRGERQRPHRLRRHHGAAPGATGGRLVVPIGAAAQHPGRCMRSSSSPTSPAG